jgi:ankyrin repeat protein
MSRQPSSLRVILRRHPGPSFDSLTKMMQNGECDANEAKSFESTPIRVALEENCESRVIKLLLDYNANMGSDQFGWNPLHGAAFNGSDAGIITLLFKAGANINSQSYQVGFI